MSQSEAPSTSALSSSSAGTASNARLNTSTAIGEATCGNTMPQYESASPTELSSTNSGTISAWNGISSPARTSHCSAAAPRKRTRENANAARLAVSTVPAVISDAVRKLLNHQWRMSPFSSSVRYAASVSFVARQVTGATVVSASGFSDVATAHANGTRQITASPLSTV